MASWEPQAAGTTDRALVKGLVAQRPRRLYGFCGYCGCPCVGLTCHRHRGLLVLDPNMPHTASSVTTYPEFMPTCPRPECGERNPSQNLWCRSCGYRLYLTENELKRRAA